MVLWGPFAYLVWVVLYGIPIGLVWLYEKYLIQRGGFWIILGVPAYLLIATACVLIGYLIRNEFLIAPFIGYVIAGGMVIRALVLVINLINFKRWLQTQHLDKPQKSKYVKPQHKVNEELENDAKYVTINCGACAHQFRVLKNQGTVKIKCPNCGRESRITT